MTCIVDGHHGVYVPNVWAERYGREASRLAGVNRDDVAVLLYGPDHDFYWESWDQVLSDYEHVTAEMRGSRLVIQVYRLWQDGDLFEYNQDEATEMFGDYEAETRAIMFDVED